MASGPGRSETCTTEERFPASRALARTVPPGTTVPADERDAWLFERLLGARELASEVVVAGATDVEVATSSGFFCLRFEIFLDQVVFCSVRREERRDLGRSSSLA